MSASSCNWSRAVGPTDVDYAPDDSATLYLQARRSLAVGEDQEALETLLELVERDEVHLEGHILYQDLARRLGGGTASTMGRYYDELRDDGSAAVPYLKSRLKGPGGRSDLLRVAIERDEGLHYAYLDLAEIWDQEGETERALEAAIRASEAAPNDPQVNLRLARSLEATGRAKDAAERYRRYLAAMPGDLPVFETYLRLTLYSLGDIEAAREVLSRLETARGADDPDLRLHRAALLWRTGDLDGARDIYRVLLRSDPLESRAVLNLANSYYLSDQRSEDEKRAEWPKARRIYRYYLSLSSRGEIGDLLDSTLTVPSRIARIDEFLGPDPDPSLPTVEDL
ncbi:MAG: tetratricopeptide repeat protein [Planctomycetota bacterium]